MTRVGRRVIVVGICLVLAAVAYAAYVDGARRSARAMIPALATLAQPGLAELSELLSARAGLYDKSEPRFAPADLYDKLEEEARRVRPVIKPYKVKADLSNVDNRVVFRSELKPKMLSMIAKNGFVVTTTDKIQMFQLYESNSNKEIGWNGRVYKFPSFITTDSMLNTYHMFYDYSLREVETEKLYPAAVNLTDAMLAASEEDLSAAATREVKDAARRNLAFFAVARKLLTGVKPPSSVADLADEDLRKIEAHGGSDMSAVMGSQIDFSRFVPRGHYTRSETLKKYFKAMSWYGLAPFPTNSVQQTRRALMVVRNLQRASLDSVAALKLWDNIYGPTAFYVGTSDDFTVYQYAELKKKVYGSNPPLSAFEDQGKLNAFVKETKRLPMPRIESDPSSSDGPGFRFMGQRFIPDTRIMAELVNTKVPGRYFPNGVDVFAALGSDRALGIAKSVYHSDKYPGYEAQMDKMRKEISATPRKTWESNMYYGWLWSLQSVTKPAPAGYPTFMRNTAWQDKSVLTALGSWTELRHDTILYGLQNVVSSCQDGFGARPVPVDPKGYVEPNLEFWTKLKWLNDYSVQGLESRGLLSAHLKREFEKLGGMVDFCRKITIKELTNAEVTYAEYKTIEYYGTELKDMMRSIVGGVYLTGTDKDMAVVADIHTVDDMVLEEATGRVGAIYVVVPIEGKLYLTKGAVYTQYEFEHPASDRLTDEAWQQMVSEGRQPDLAEWMYSFFLKTKKKPSPTDYSLYLGD